MNQSEQLRDLKERMAQLGLSTNGAIQQLLVADHVKQEERKRRDDEGSFTTTKDKLNIIEDSMLTSMRTIFHIPQPALRQVSEIGSVTPASRRRLSLWDAFTTEKDSVKPQTVDNDVHQTTMHKRMSTATYAVPINIPSQRGSVTTPSRRRQSLWGASSTEEDERFLDTSLRRRCTARTKSMAMDLSVHRFVLWKASEKMDEKQRCQKHVMRADKRDKDLRKTIQDFYKESDFDPSFNQQRYPYHIQPHVSLGMELISKQSDVQYSRRTSHSLSMLDDAEQCVDQLEDTNEKSEGAHESTNEKEVEWATMENHFEDEEPPEELDAPTIFDCPSRPTTLQQQKQEDGYIRRRHVSLLPTNTTQSFLLNSQPSWSRSSQRDHTSATKERHL